MANPIAQRAVRLVAESVAWAPVYAAADGNSRLVDLASPNLLEAIASQLLLHGNALLQLIGDWDGLPIELFALRPKRVSVARDGPLRELVELIASR